MLLVFFKGPPVGQQVIVAKVLVRPPVLAAESLSNHRFRRALMPLPGATHEAAGGPAGNDSAALPIKTAPKRGAASYHIAGFCGIGTHAGKKRFLDSNAAGSRRRIALLVHARRTR